jgi:phage terminase large subunit-like protein
VGAQDRARPQREGDLTIVDAPGQDVTDIADIIQQIADAGLLPEKQGIGVDAAGIGDIVDELVTESRGIKLEQIVAIPQGWKLNGAIKSMERDLAGGMIEQHGSDLMAFCVGNARIVQQGNAVSITKQASGSAKIDPLMAGFSAQAVMNMNPEASGGKSFWESAA